MSDTLRSIAVGFVVGGVLMVILAQLPSTADPMFNVHCGIAMTLASIAVGILSIAFKE